MSDFEWGIFSTMEVLTSRPKDNPDEGGFVTFHHPDSGDEVFLNICDRAEFERVSKAKRVSIGIDWWVVA